MVGRQQHALGNQPHAEFVLAGVIGAHRDAFVGDRLVGEVDVKERSDAGHLDRESPQRRALAAIPSLTAWPIAPTYS